MPSIINSDDGVISGTSGLKTTGGNDGALNIQANGTTAISIAANGTVTLPTTALPVASGGTGTTSLTANNVILGNGTSAVQFVAAGTNGNVLTSNGTTWTSAPIVSGGDYVMNVYTTPGTWTKPAGLKAIKVTVVGGGGGASNVYNNSGGGGGGASIEYIDAPAIPGPQPYTVGTGGAGRATPGPGGDGSAGNTSSFGGPTAFLSATGGAGGSATFVLGGLGSNGQLNLSGDSGAAIPDSTAPSFPLANFGGGSLLAGAAWANGTSGAITPSVPRGYGAGGVGATGPGAPAISGSAGVVIVEEFY